MFGATGVPEHPTVEEIHRRAEVLQRAEGVSRLRGGLRSAQREPSGAVCRRLVDPPDAEVPE